MSVWAGIAIWLILHAGAFVCPMHAEVTSALPGSCGKCGMPLMRRPDPAAPEYDMRVHATPRGSGAMRLDLTLTRADGSAPPAFIVTHERELHLFVIASDLSSFDHVHPRRAGAGRYLLDLPIRQSEEYVVFSDFVPSDAPPQLLQQIVSVPRAQATKTARIVKAPVTTVQTVRGMRVNLEAEEVRNGTPALLTFTFTDAETGAPIEDLEPYLGAAGHLFFTDPEFQMAAHSHPLEELRSARVRFLVRFPASTIFRIWLQVQRRGDVITTEWTVNVPVD